jgi:hypothetical protein
MTTDHSRRQFLTTAAAAAAWTTVGPLPGVDTAALAATASTKLKLGVAR